MKTLNKFDEELENIARIMSDEARCTVTANDVRLEVCRPTTSIYIAVTGSKCIVCTVSKWKKPCQYVVTST